MRKQPAVYIITNKKNGTLYTGVTSDLIQRIWQHKAKLIDGFSKRYNLDRLVYMEVTQSIISAIEREKQIKAGSRAKKIKLIESTNPSWQDLYPQLSQ